jgi:hypothetical protein
MLNRYVCFYWDTFSTYNLGEIHINNDHLCPSSADAKAHAFPILLPAPATTIIFSLKPIVYCPI